MKGSEFATQVQFVDASDWEEAILAAKGSWIVPAMVDVPVPGGASIRVSADYFAIGEPDDYLYVPMRGTTAQRVADVLGYLLPTKKIVDLTWAAAAVRLTPQPKPEVVGTQRQVSVAAAREHSAAVQAQLAGRGAGGALVRGHKKDAGVLTNRLSQRPAQVSIYGWYTPVNLPGLALANHPIQPLSLVHEWTYADYSHGISFVDPTMQIGGSPASVASVLGSANQSALVSDEGPLKVLRIPPPQPTVSAPAAPSPEAPAPAASAPAAPAVLRQGSTGVQVRMVQGWLASLGFTVSVDGDFGAQTDAAVRAFQTAHGLAVDGAVGPEVMTALRQLVTNTPTTTPRPAPQPVAPADYPFIQAAHYTAGRSGTPIRLIVIHDMEAARTSTTAHNVAAWFAGASAPQASAHYCVDRASVYQCVKDEDMAWHAPGANAQGIGVEHAGFATDTTAVWNADDELKISAQLVARLCKQYGLPVQFVDAAGLLAGDAGITTHVEVSQAWKKSNHTDPGPNFPMNDYLALVQAAM
jgi:N-acetyl-anhydromuramyl-L-alanine amidase AmpD